MDEYQPAWKELPHVDQARLVHDLQTLGVYAGTTLLVHSSLSRIGNVEGGAETVVRALLEAVAADGTVLFPTLTGREEDGPDHPPFVDVRTTSCWTGRIPQTALAMPSSRRSLHPTHSIVAIGEHAVAYTTGHEQGCSPCDERSPYYRLIKENGLILLLGVDQESNTTLHCVEELQAVPYHLQPEVTSATVVDRDGTARTVRNRLHLWGWERDFARLDQPLLNARAMVMGTVGSATARLMRADRLADLSIRELRSDRLYLLSAAARTAWIEQSDAD